MLLASFVVIYFVNICQFVIICNQIHFMMLIPMSNYICLIRFNICKLCSMQVYMQVMFYASLYASYVHLCKFICKLCSSMQVYDYMFRSMPVHMFRSMSDHMFRSMSVHIAYVNWTYLICQFTFICLIRFMLFYAKFMLHTLNQIYIVICQFGCHMSLSFPFLMNQANNEPNVLYVLYVRMTWESWGIVWEILKIEYDLIGIQKSRLGHEW